MGEKIFGDSKERTTEELVKRIQEIVSQRFTILDEQNDIEKWNTVPKLLLLDDNKQQQILSFAEFLDSLLVSIGEKAMYIVSICGLLEFGGIKLEEYETGDLFTLADYYQNSNINEIKNTIQIIGNKQLITVVREKTLDIEVRKKLLLDIANRAINDKINTTNKKEIIKFITEVVSELEEKDYYDLVK